MGCASSSDTKHVIYVKPRAESGTNLVNGLKQENSNHPQLEQRKNKTSNNNNVIVNDQMLSDRNKEAKVSSQQPISPANNEAATTDLNEDKGSGIKQGDLKETEDKESAQSPQDELIDNVKDRLISGDKRLGNGSAKKINRKVSDARTIPSSITEWETDSELANDKDIEDIDATTNKDKKDENVTSQTEAGDSKLKVPTIQANHLVTDEMQDSKEVVHKTVNETDSRETGLVLASYVGSDGNKEIGKKSDDITAKAYASYVGTGTETKHNDNDKTEGHASPHAIEAVQTLNGSDAKLNTKINQNERDQKHHESTVDTRMLDAQQNILREEEEVEQGKADAEENDPSPTLVKAKAIMPGADILKVLADQVKQSPIGLKPSLASLVKRLTKPATTDLEKVWAFYRWIVINIKYDVDGFFGDAPAKPSDPSTVLKTGVALCEGYTNLLMAFCEKSNVNAKIITGFAKPYGCTIGDDVSKLDSCKHKWNAVRIDRKWFLMDCTWGAGFVKPKDKKYIRWPNDFYFLTDPEIFISDHFPMMDNDYETSSKWQLLEMPLTLEIFMKRVNMDQPGKEWGILTHHHPYAVIDVQNEAEIMVEESHTAMLDYMVHMRNNDYQLMDPFTFCYKLDAKTFKVHVRPPATGEYVCQIYGRRVVDGKDAHFQPLVLYKLNCTQVYDRPREFPKHDTVFGPVHDIARYGFSHTGNVLYKAEFGEVMILLNPAREVHFVPHLYIGDTEFGYLRENCIVQYSEDFRHVSVSVRLPFEGFFRLTLCGKRGEKQVDDDDADDARSNKSTSAPVYNIKFRRPLSNTDEMKPFVSYLIDNRQASDKDPFPFAHTSVLKYKCCLLQPTDKEVKTEREIKVCVRSLFLERVKAGDDLIPKVDETTFAGNTVATKPDAKFIIYGSESKSGDDFVPLYECTTSK